MTDTQTDTHADTQTDKISTFITRKGLASLAPIKLAWPQRRLDTKPKS